VSVDGHGVCTSTLTGPCIHRARSNKWVLNDTKAPLFFLTTQLFIAVCLFLIADTLRMLPDRLTLDVKVCKGLVPMVGLSVLGLRYAPTVIHALLSLPPGVV
jgi:hypothetical protein